MRQSSAENTGALRCAKEGAGTEVKEREYYFDTLRYLAAIWVFTTHFIAFVDAGLFVYLNRMPVGLVMRGISGKLCVAVFSVILGYFSYRKGQSSKESAIRYIAKRYIYFVIAGLTINIIYAAAGRLGFLDNEIGLLQPLISAVLLRDDILGSFWFMRPFLAGSLLGFLAGRYHLGYIGAIALAAVLTLVGQVWVALALFGVLLALIIREEKLQKYLENKWIQALIVVVVFVLINRSESTITYLFDGVFAVGIILVVAHNRFLKNILECKWLRKVNKSYMGFYLIHQLGYNTIGAYMLNTWLQIPFKPRFLLVYVLCLALNIPLALLLDYIVGGISRYAGKLIDRILPSNVEA